jgi:gliding motility-associated-like protein
MKTLTYIARYTVLATLLYLLQALAPAMAQSAVYPGDTTKLEVVVQNGYSYEWELYDNGAVNIAKVPGNCPVTSATFIGGNVGSTVNVQWLKPGIYYYKVTVWDVAGCNMNFKVGMVTVQEALPVATITPPDPAGICSGTMAELEVNITEPGPWDITYTDGTNSRTITGITVTPYILKVNPLVTTRYWITAVSNKNGKNTKPSAKVTQNVLPLPILVINDPDPVCEPATVDLTLAAVTAGSDAVLNYEYYKDQDATVRLSNPSKVDSSGTYYIRAINPSTSCSDIKPVQVIVNKLLTPEFSIISNFCINEIAPTLPTVSGNGIPGTWNPAKISTARAGVTTYLFTPSSAICSKTFPINVTVNKKANPEFNPIGPLCQNDPAPALPPMSNNGYTGSWNPSTISTVLPGPFSFTFTPDAGLCAKDTTIEIVVNPEVITVFDPIGPLCPGSVPPLLPTTDKNGLTGTWSPATISTSTSGVFDYVFTPDGVACVPFKPFKILITDPIVIAETHQNIGYSIEHIGSIDLTVTGGFGNFTYLWNNGATTEDLTELDKGTYTVVVTDENNCSDSLSVTITRIELMTMSAVKHDACAGLKGSIDFTFTNVPDGVYDILYTGGKFPKVPVKDGIATVEAPAGTYNNLKLFVNGNGTISDVSVTIITLPAITLKANPVRSECSNQRGSIELTFSNVPTGLYTITHDDGEFTSVQVFNNAAKFQAVAKTYTNLMLTLGSGCSTNKETITLDPPLGITPEVDPPVQPTCKIQTATIVVTYPSGSDYEYSKDGGENYQDSATFAGLPPSATYQIKTREKVTGCESEITPVTIYSVPSNPDPALVSVINPSCDVPTGSFTITNVDFGTGYDYSLDGINYLDSKTFSGLTPDSVYELRVRLKSTRCESLTSVPIPPIPPLWGAPVASIISQPTCIQPLSSIVVSSPPFNSGYVYSKDGGNTYQDSTIFRNLLPGTYQIRVKSKIAVSALCGSDILELIIPKPVVPEKPIAAITQANCTDALGIITISSPVGADIMYSINGSAYDYTSGIFKDLAAGKYVVSAKNSGGCISEPSDTITLNKQPETPLAPIADVIQPNCEIPTGTIAVSSDITGLNFSIDGIDYSNNTGIFSGLVTGNYFVTARNMAGCISPASGKLTIKASPIVPNAPIASVIQADCNISTGTITVSSPTTSLHFSIDGVDYTNTSGIFSGLLPKDYFVTARNLDGCTSDSSGIMTVIPQPEIPDVPTVILTQPDCSNPTGTITITSATNGLLFSIDGLNYFNTTVFSGLLPKDYFVTAKNSLSCISPTLLVTIKTQPATPIVPQAVLVAAECEKYPIQKIYAHSGIAALPAGITLNWYDDKGVPVSDPFLNAVGTATYYAESTNGACVSSGRTPVTLTIYPAPAVLISQNPVPECATNPLHTLDARTYVSDVSGVIITWWTAASGGSQVTNTTWNSTGSRTFYAEAFNGQCASAARTPITLTINPLPDAPKAIVTVNPSCNFPNGTVVVNSPKEGTGYEYNIDGGNYQSSATFTLLKGGDHWVRVMQTSTGCESDSSSVTVDAIPPPPVLAVTSIEECKCNGDTTGSINFTVTNAKDGVYKITYEGGAFDNVSVQGGLAKVDASAGTYINLTIDANGCTSEALSAVTVTEPSPITITESVTDIDLKSGRKGAIDLVVSGGTANYSYIWSNGAITKDIKDLSDGTYIITVTDKNECKQSKPITIPIPNNSPVAIADSYSVGCDVKTGNLVANDYDPDGDPFYIDLKPVVNVQHGNLTLNIDGTFEYKPDLSFSGTDYFSYAIYNGKHYLGDTAKVVLNIIADFDCDAIPDDGDVDADGDGILNVNEVLAGQDWRTTDTDGDGIPNYLDIDSDNDGIVDNVEAQDTKGYIKPLDLDTDGDGLDDAYDPDQKGKLIIPVDTDKDGIPDFLDSDSDNDLVPDYIEGHDFNNDGKADNNASGKDSDHDGLDDAYDTLNRYTTSGNMTGSNATMQDFDGDGMRDWRDDNDDNDKYLTRFEDLNADGDFSNDDIDYDGHPEYLDFGRDCDLFIPNIFTPNSDNIHDYFVIYCLKDYPDAKIYIFDQNGNKVFEKAHYGNLEYWGSASQAWWNGTNSYNGRASNDLVPVGTYYYVLNLGNGEVKKSYLFISY